MKFSLLTVAMGATTALAAPTDDPARLPPQGQSTVDNSRPVLPGPFHPGHGVPHPAVLPSAPEETFEKRGNGKSWDEVTSEAIAGYFNIPSPISDPKTGISFTPKTAKDLVGQCQILFGDTEPVVFDVELKQHQAKCVAIVWNCAMTTDNTPEAARSGSLRDAAFAEKAMVSCVMGAAGLAFKGGKKGKPNWDYAANERQAVKKLADIKGEKSYFRDSPLDQPEDWWRLKIGWD